MKRICVGFLLLLLLVSAPIALSQRKRATKARTKESTPQSKAKVSAENDETRTEVGRAWDHYFIVCGDSFYADYAIPHHNEQKPYCQFRTVSIVYEDAPLSEPDRLNGIERKVVSRLRSVATRCYKEYPQRNPDGWDEWFDGTQLTMDLTKKNGAWDHEMRFNMSIPNRDPKFQCSDIPK